MDLNNPVIRLCAEGTRAEFEGRSDDALALYMQAWNAARDDYDACVAAHYVARFQEGPQETLRWNQEALTRADRVGGDRFRDFYPSLYVNMGRSHEMVGNLTEAQRYYNLAAGLGLVHQGEKAAKENGMEFDKGISLHTECTDAELDFIWKGILDYNRTVGPMMKYPPYEALNLILKDADGKIVGGLQSKIYLRCIYINALWIDDAHRKSGYGKRLMAEAESRAKEQGCGWIHLDTFSFQAIDFYRRLGYEVFATLDEYPDGVVRYFLKKRL